MQPNPTYHPMPLKVYQSNQTGVLGWGGRSGTPIHMIWKKKLLLFFSDRENYRKLYFEQYNEK